MRSYKYIGAAIAGVIFLFWLIDGLPLWLIIGLVIGWLVMVDEHEIYASKAEAHRIKCKVEGLKFDPERSLGGRGDFLFGMLANGAVIGTFLWCTDRTFTLLFFA